MAVGERTVEFRPNPSPPVLFSFWDGQPQGLAALRGDEFAGGDEELKAQRVQADAFKPAELALEEHDQVVGEHGQAQRGLRAPEARTTGSNFAICTG